MKKAVKITYNASVLYTTFSIPPFIFDLKKIKFVNFDLGKVMRKFVEPRWVRYFQSYQQIKGCCRVVKGY